MTFKAVIAAVLGSVVLVGCGSSSSDSKDSVSEYSLSDYDGRIVNTDTLIGTWVSAGTSYIEYTNEDGSGQSRIAMKNYFVITEQNGSYFMDRCDSSDPAQITLDGTSIRISSDLFTGTVVNNTKITGKANPFFEDDEGSVNIENDTTMLKISDQITPFATITANIEGEEIKTNVSCYQQANGVLKFNNLNATSEGIAAYPINIQRYKGDRARSDLFYSVGEGLDLDFDSGDGDSVSFEVTNNSSFSEIVNFNATNGSDSITGNIVVQLPAQ